MLRIAESKWILFACIAVAGCGAQPVGDGNAVQSSGATSDDDDSDNSDHVVHQDAGPEKTNKGESVKDAGKTAAKKPDATADAGGHASGGSIPCDVSSVVQKSCQVCHGKTPSGGAPFSLMTLEDFQADVPDGTQKVYEAAYDAVNKTGPGGMPPTSVDPLSDADKKTLSDWLKAGAQGATCSGGAVMGTDDAGTATPIAGGSGGAHAEAIMYDDPDMKCYEFRAFTQGDRNKPYTTPTTPDFYVGFNFTPPWQGTQYVRSFRSLIDNAAVLHHWLFFQQSDLSPDSVTEDELGAHPDGQMLAGWAPGGSNLYFDPDVGFEVPGDVSYLLETHYNNKTGAPAPDASGVELCVTPTKPAHVAALSWVGTDAIAGTEATGHCAPETNEEIHLIAAQPHMHLKGRHMKVVLEHNGQETVIHDKDFDFNFQRSYVENVLIEPGDELYTTCTYSEFATFGKGTNDEMCYFFSIYWPKGALQSTGVGTFIHGVNSCMDI